MHVQIYEYFVTEITIIEIYTQYSFKYTTICGTVSRYNKNL